MNGLFALRFLIEKPVKQKWIRKVDVLQVLLDYALFVVQIIQESFFKSEANEAAATQIEAEALSIGFFYPFDENVAVRN